MLKINIVKSEQEKENVIETVSFEARRSISGDLMIYDLDNNTVEQVEEKFDKRAYHSMNLTKGKLYLLGGKSTLTQRYLFINARIANRNTKQLQTQSAATASKMVFDNNKRNRNKIQNIICMKKCHHCGKVSKILRKCRHNHLPGKVFCSKYCQKATWNSR